MCPWSCLRRPWKNSTYFLRDAGFWTFFYELLALGSHLCLGEATRTWQSLVRRVSPRRLLGNFQSQVMVLPRAVRTWKSGQYFNEHFICRFGLVGVVFSVVLTRFFGLRPVGR